MPREPPRLYGLRETTVGWRAVAPLNEVAMLMALVVCMILPLQTFTFDEYHHLRRLYGGLPVTRSTVITTRYLLARGVTLGRPGDRRAGLSDSKDRGVRYVPAPPGG